MILIVLFFISLQAFANDTSCMAITLEKEASGEGLLGKRGVLDVIQTRMKESGKTACQVILQPNQFSWTKDIETFPSPSKKELTTYRFVSKMKPVVEGAKYFHRKDIKPSWAKKMKPKLKIKSHVFY